MLTLQALAYIEWNYRTGGPIWKYVTETLTSCKGAKPDRVIQLNCGKVRTHASYKTTRTWENFNNRGKKMILLSDKPWLIANNSKSFANGSKSITRNNLGLCKRSEIYLYLELSKTVIDLMISKYRFDKERYVKQINDIRE